MMSGKIHMVAGPIGVGKTTYAQELTDRINGVRFSIDEWMLSLFGPDILAHPDPTWIFDRVKRCNRRILDTALPVALRGVDIVLDLGFTLQDERKAVADAAHASALIVEMHWLQGPKSLRWERVEKRNDQGGKTFAFKITRSMFDFMEARLEEPDSEELLALNGRRISPHETTVLDGTSR
ncbi:ATP-binding protein [Rhizobium sp. LjRoot98]|uniref:AAA family ATPase n=1 Tax=Rhizobium sp. LjRoot98 TaxID=3342345 RepID=UPI003ECD623C